MYIFLFSFSICIFSFFFFFNDTATTEIYTLSLHDALPISLLGRVPRPCGPSRPACSSHRSEEHTSELQSHHDLVCRLLLEKKKKYNNHYQLKKKKEKKTHNNTTLNSN